MKDFPEIPDSAPLHFYACPVGHTESPLPVAADQTVGEIWDLVSRDHSNLKRGIRISLNIQANGERVEKLVDAIRSANRQPEG